MEISKISGSGTAFMAGGQWYKGNTHTHSLISDGDHSHEDVIRFYRNRGYNFLTMTEHDIYTGLRGFDSDSFIIIPGMEATLYGPKGVYHGLLLLDKGQASDPDRPEIGELIPCLWEDETAYQERINRYSAEGNLVIVHSPHYNNMTPEYLAKYDGYCAIEIYNHACQTLGNLGNAESLWDYLLRQGRRVWGVACDDLHFGDDSRYIENGWIMVKAPGLSTKEITAAIESGSFYSTQGPEIYDFSVQDDVVHIECSKVTRAYITTYSRFEDGKSTSLFNGTTCWAEEAVVDGDHMVFDKNLFSIWLFDNESYVVRITIEDEYKKLAWSNPIFINR